MLPTLRCVACAALLAVAAGCFGAGGPELRRQRHALEALEATVPPAAGEPFAGAAALERAALVEEVLRRNPTIAAARFAWRAALARYPQETALPDPTFAYSIGPRTFGSSTVAQEAHRFDIGQPIPFPGKLSLRGAAALAEAEAAARDHDAVRLRLATMASLLYDEYWLLARAAEINDEHLALVRELREIANARYESGVAEQQDPLRAEVEETGLLHRAVELATARRVTAQQIALLLHERSGAALPPPPSTVTPVAAPGDDDATALESALAERPELRAADARVRAREAGEDLARRDFLPDFRLMGVYDRSWNETDMRPMVGLEIEVPLQIARRRAAVEQARAELEQARRERARIEDEVTTEWVTARERLAEARHLLELVRDRLLPATRDQLTAARSGYEAGRVDFADVIEAERALRSASLAAEEALADTNRRAAELAAALGRIPGAALSDPSVPAAAPAEAHGAHHE
jgi:cobalt-zinc-cadmium efflux system outer membrane protein